MEDGSVCQTAVIYTIRLFIFRFEHFQYHATEDGKIMAFVGCDKKKTKPKKIRQVFRMDFI